MIGTLVIIDWKVFMSSISIISKFAKELITCMTEHYRSNKWKKKTSFYCHRWQIIFIYLSILSEAREEVEISLWLAAKRRDIPSPSVTFSSSYTSGARGLKIGMHNPYMDGTKVYDKIFDILSRSRDI